MTDEQLQRLMSKLDGPAPAPGLDDRIAARLEGAATQPPRRLAWLRRPVSVQPVWAAIAASLLVILGATAGALWRSTPVTRPAPAIDRPSNAERITFALEAQSAHQVDLIGDFTKWKPVPLEPESGGRWSRTIEVPRGRHRYQFLVDGVPATDPIAERHRDDGFGGRDAILEL